MIKPDITPEAIDRLIESIKVSAVDTYLDAIAALRTQAARVAELEAELARFREERSFVIGWNDGFSHGVREAAEVCDKENERCLALASIRVPAMSVEIKKAILALIKEPTT